MGAYYLNRLGVNVNVYEKDLDDKWVKIDFGKLHKEMRRKNIVRRKKTVYIGRQKFKTTIVIEILPEREYEARIRKNKKGQNLSDK